MPFRIAHNKDTVRKFKREDTKTDEVVCITEPSKTEYDPTAEHKNGESSYACVIFLTIISWIFIIFAFPFVIWFCFKVVLQHQRLVVFKLGRLQKLKGPGIVFINPFIVDLHLMDLRTTTYVVKDKPVMTLSAIEISVGAVVFYRILDCRRAVLHVRDVESTMAELTEASVESVLRSKHLGDILERGDEMCELIQLTLKEQSENWGIFVERFELKYLTVPVDLQKALAAETIAACEAHANLIHVESEKKVYAFVNEAVRYLDSSPQAHHLLNLITLKQITSSHLKPSVNVSLSPPEVANWFNTRN